MSPRQFTASLDFDGTIHDLSQREPGYKMGKPFHGARECIVRLKELGATIIVFTCRGRAALDLDGEHWTSWHRENGDLEHVANWLDHFSIPFDEITAIKPIADVYLDDKAVPFDGDWSHAEREILSVFYLGARS